MIETPRPKFMEKTVTPAKGPLLVAGERRGEEGEAQTKHAPAVQEISATLLVPAFHSSSDGEAANTSSTGFGWQLAVTDNRLPPAVKALKETGPVADWNAANPGREIRPGDLIIGANGVRCSGSAMAFVERVSKMASGNHGRQDGGPIEVIIQLQRPATQDLWRQPAPLGASSPVAASPPAELSSASQAKPPRRRRPT